ncbi:Flagellar-associated PapD-like [Novymonas esmeraldas]|uniref:Flagellar-associated PapD-like n=1 Tax=Novymonas esmeraldas TaxID=1808958 RepID=A0AAW0F5K6_9TRYP
MDFLSFDNGVIKNPFYRKDLGDGDAGSGAQRKWRRQPRDSVNSAAPAYTRNLLSKDKTPFQCSPSAICFANYDVGGEHKIQLAFTNTATVPKTFRVMPILPRYANVLSIEYAVPPRIPPGLSWNVTVKYRPRELSDIATAVYVKTDEGYFAVALTSSKKAFVFSVEPKSVSFGTVIVGEKRSKRITLRNSGAMPGTVIVGGDFKSLLDQKHTNPATGKKMSFFHISPQQYKIEIAPFAAAEIVVNFAPLNPTQIDSEITFTEKGTAPLIHAVPLTGSSTDLPVYLTTTKLEFGACFYGERYWDELIVVNKANIAAVAEFQVPSFLTGTLAVSPYRVCVQSGEEYSVRVAFTPTKDLPRKFSASIKCVVQDQTLPLSLSIEGVLSHRAPRLPSTALDVGAIAMHTMQTVQVPVANDASVKQLVGFESLPPWISAAPEALVLLPYETASFSLKVEAPQEGRFSQRLKLINEFGDEQYISLSGYGTRPPVAVSARTLLLPPCNIGRSVSATTVLTNTSGKPSQFSFLVPCSFFRVAPNAGVLQPGESVVVAIIFDAPLEFEFVEPMQTAAAAPRPTRAKKDPVATLTVETQLPQKRFMYGDWDSGGDKEPWSRHKQFRVQCTFGDSEDESCFVVLRCCAVKPRVGIEDAEKPPSTPPPKKQKPAENEARLASAKASIVADAEERGAATPNCKAEVFVEFGKVPIHHSSIRSCKVRNVSDVPCAIRVPPLNPFSAFSVITVAFDEMAPLTEALLPLSFHPHVYGRFDEVIKLELAMRDGTVAFVFVNVQGTCCPTQLTIAPAEGVPQQDATAVVSLHHVAFECTRKNDSARKSLSFHNVGSFPLDVVISSFSDHESGPRASTVAVHVDPSGAFPFLVHPRTFTLLPNTKQMVDIIFAPADAGVYSRQLNVTASGESRELLLEGRSVSGGIYCFVPIPDARSGKPTAISFEGEMGCRPDFPVSLPFVEDESKTLLIGNLLKGPSIEYEVQNWEQTRQLEMPRGWVVAPLSQTVGGGKEARLSIQRFFPDDEDGDGGTWSTDSLFPFRFTIVMKGEGVAFLSYRVLYVVCTD